MSLEQAQIAFEKGGRPTMARRMTEFRRSLAPPPPDSSPPEIAQGVRDMADTAFSELDAGELRFALAEAAQPAAGDGQCGTPWSSGGLSKSKSPPKSSFTRTLPPPWMGELEPQTDLGSVPAPSMSFSAPPVPTISRITDAVSPVRPVAEPRIDVPSVVPPAVDRDLEAAPALLPSPGDPPVAWHPSGVVLVRGPATRRGRRSVVRLDALRVVSGSASTRVLHRRTRDAETREVLGGLGSPFVRVAGDTQLVLGARPEQRLALLAVEEDLAFVREDMLVGFELALQYENGRVPLEPGAAEESAVVQFRGSGMVVVDVPGELASLPSGPDRPLIARREWIVGWFGRLVTRALSSTESPGGHRGLIGFWGEGTVLVCIG